MRLPPLLQLAVRALIVGLLTSIFLVCLVGLARGEEPPADQADRPSVPLAEGESAPYAGVLVSEASVDRAYALAVEREECRGNLEASERVRASLADGLATAVSTPSRQSSAVGSHSEWPWVALGYVAGAVSAGLAVWGAVEVLRAH